ncbi:MAG TPA: beta-N-acetylhexosaminidase, partial [Aquabacterium sp.]|nr:beta-N-acetylhexosaminidase [Aquabacterium sp.]
AALREGDLLPEQVLRSLARLQALAQRYPAAPQVYGEAQRSADDALMHSAWARGLSALGGARPPRRDAPLRVVTQASVASDGVSEAGAPAEAAAALFTGFTDVQWVSVPDLCRLTPDAMPADGRVNLLVSNHRTRYPDSAAALRPDLHLVLWNPFQAGDIAAPAIVSWGYADGALAALRTWLEGKAEATGLAPVPLATRALPA